MGLLDKLADKTMDTVLDVVATAGATAVTAAVYGTAYLVGKFTEPTPESIKDLSEESVAAKEKSAFNKLLDNEMPFESRLAKSTFESLIATYERGHLSREDVQHQLEIKKAHEEGYRQGNVDAAKKFAALLEQSDNMRIGSFAIGYYVAKLGGNSDEKLGVIVDALGDPNSFALSDYVRSENNKILRDNLRFDEICNKYLDSLNAEQLQSVDNFLQEIINAGGATYVERSFYQNEWTAYLNRRIK